jgi:hypothetical protein
MLLETRQHGKERRVSEICEERCYVRLTDAGPVRVWRLSPIEGGPVQFIGRGTLLMQSPPGHPPMQIPFEFPVPGDTAEQAFDAHNAAFEVGAEAKQAEVMAEVERQRHRVVIAADVPQRHLRAAPAQS